MIYKVPTTININDVSDIIFPIKFIIKNSIRATDRKRGKW